MDDESLALSARNKKRQMLVAAVSLLLLVAGIMAILPNNSQHSATLVNNENLFDEILTMELPKEEQDVEMEGMAAKTDWAACKEKGVEIAKECVELNPVDPEGCKDRGKEAAKVCYKDMGKMYKDMWKTYGKDQKATWKTTKGDDDSGSKSKSSKGDDDDSSSSD